MGLNATKLQVVAAACPGLRDLELAGGTWHLYCPTTGPRPALTALTQLTLQAVSTARATDLFDEAAESATVAAGPLSYRRVAPNLLSLVALADHSTPPPPLQVLEGGLPHVTSLSVTDWQAEVMAERMAVAILVDIDDDMMYHPTTTWVGGAPRDSFPSLPPGWSAASSWSAPRP